MWIPVFVNEELVLLGSAKDVLTCCTAPVIKELCSPSLPFTDSVYFLGFGVFLFFFVELFSCKFWFTTLSSYQYQDHHASLLLPLGSLVGTFPWRSNSSMLSPSFCSCAPQDLHTQSAHNLTISSSLMRSGWLILPAAGMGTMAARAQQSVYDSSTQGKASRQESKRICKLKFSSSFPDPMANHFLTFCPLYNSHPHPSNCSFVISNLSNSTFHKTSK